MLLEFIQKSNKIGIFTHVNPDGDAIGSSMALCTWLEAAGKNARIFYPTPPPESLEFMIPKEYASRIQVWDKNAPDKMEEIVRSCDLLIGIDFNTVDRIREWGPAFKASKAKKILIDHHIGPEKEWFDLVISETEISSACELLYGILKQVPGIDGDITMMPDITRRSLLTGMTTDTNNFANSVYPGTLAMASELMAAGTDRDSIIQALYFRDPERRLQAETYLMGQNLKITPYGISYIILDKKTSDRFALKEGDTEGFVNVPLHLERVHVSIFLKEDRPAGRVRVSVRSKKGWSARDFAKTYFHGGGHELASGGYLVLGQDIASIDHTESYVQKCIDEWTGK